MFFGLLCKGICSLGWNFSALYDTLKVIDDNLTDRRYIDKVLHAASCFALSLKQRCLDALSIGFIQRNLIQFLGNRMFKFCPGLHSFIEHWWDQPGCLAYSNRQRIQNPQQLIYKLIIESEALPQPQELIFKSEIRLKNLKSRYSRSVSRACISPKYD